MKWFKDNILSKNALTQKLLGNSVASAASTPKPTEKKNVTNVSNMTDTNKKSERLISSNPNRANISSAPAISAPASDREMTAKPRKKQEVELGTLWVIACGFEHAIFLVRHS